MVLFCGLGWVLSTTVPCVAALTPMTFRCIAIGIAVVGGQGRRRDRGGHSVSTVGPTSFAATGVVGGGRIEHDVNPVILARSVLVGNALLLP